MSIVPRKSIAARLMQGFFVTVLVLAAALSFQVRLTNNLSALRAQLLQDSQQMLAVKDVIIDVSEVQAIVTTGVITQNFRDARDRFDHIEASARQDIAVVDRLSRLAGVAAPPQDFAAEYRDYLAAFKNGVLPRLAQNESTKNRFSDALVITEIVEHVNEIHLRIVNAIVRRRSPRFFLHGTTSYDAGLSGFSRVRSLAEADRDSLFQVARPEEMIWVDAFNKRYSLYLDIVEKDVLPILSSPADAVSDKKLVTLSSRINALRREALDPLEQIIESLQWDGFTATQNMATLQSAERELAGKRLAILSTLQGINDALMKKVADTNGLISRQRNQSTRWSLFTGAAGSLVALLIALLITRSITGPLAGIVLVARSVAHGDLSRDITLRRRDEVAVLADAFNEMKTAITNVLGETNSLIAAVRSGERSIRGRTEAFEGCWKELVTSVNSLTDAFIEATAELASAKTSLEERVEARTRQLEEEVINTRAERRIREDMEDRYRSLVEQLPAIHYIVEYGEVNRTVYISPQVRTILGFSPEEWLAEPELWIRQLHDEDRDRVVAEVRDRDSRGEPLDVECRMKTRDGRVRWLHIRSAILGDQAGRALIANGVMFDITERRQAEEMLRERDEQLLQAQKMDAIGRLAGGVAHDFNNLLTVIAGYADMLIESKPVQGPPWGEVEEIRKAAGRAKSLTHQLLAFSRRQILQPKVISINDRVRGLEQMLRRLIGEHIRLETCLSPSLGSVRADPGQIEQVILNIAVNARDAMPDGGLLKIETADRSIGAACRREALLSDRDVPPGDYVMLSLRDTGEGMDEEARSRIFEPFFTTKGQGKGTGLGMSMVYGIVTQSKGFIEVESAPGEGAEFRVYLPRVDAAVDGEHGEPAPLPGKTATGTILLVEDEGSVRELVRSILSKAGYAVITATDGRNALAVVDSAEAAPDLMVTDMVMPEMGGRDLGSRMTLLRPGLRILYISGYTEDSILRRGALEEGVNFLRKPFSPQELLTMVERVMKAPS
jgi:PAS domain S-box-containing protein